MDESLIPVQDTSSDPEDPEYFEKCIADFEEAYDAHCEALLDRYLSGPSALAIDIYALPEDHYGPTPKRKEGQDNG